MTQHITEIIKQAELEKLNWDFYEDAEDVEEYARKKTIPGRIVSFIFDEAKEISDAEKIIGLLTTFASRRCLVCWFLYCKNEFPLFVANSLEKYWLEFGPNRQIIDDSWLEITEPTENGSPIYDCRRQDTHSASSAVAHAARYAKKRSPHDAVISLSHAFIAFDISPIGSYVNYIDWLVNVAVPSAFDLEYMPPEKMFVMADFEIPSIMKNVVSRK
ncbi:hypothetical protein FYZ48_06325 [Gimesia chilikensis]|uniref:hypothetical protein n=1 Tax=Gimesia chilikensis TaxID=2605989 RepID=UPI0011EC1AB5|nr:hypothetical protein [Gimesia chilikensis]KAA0140884.1 hypothetical protein FYZ48_06325 [Gimesia chilikensis]